MTENNENVQVSGLDSKFMKVALTIVSVFLIFVGPTYVPYLLSDILNVDYIASIVVGACAVHSWLSVAMCSLSERK